MTSHANLTASEIAGRAAALAPLTVIGPEFNRGVRDALDTVAFTLGKGEVASAGRWLAEAECAAGLITLDDLRAAYDGQR